MSTLAVTPISTERLTLLPLLPEPADEMTSVLADRGQVDHPGQAEHQAGRRPVRAATERSQRLTVGLHGLYLLFNEGYTTSSGLSLQRIDLTTEAIRLTRLLHRQLPDEAEVTGLLALMLLTDARQAARTDQDGHLVPLADQDRGLWDTAAINEGLALLAAPSRPNAEFASSICPQHGFTNTWPAAMRSA